MRIQSHIWVAAYIRTVASAGADKGACALLVRRGEASAGAIYIKVSRLDRTAQLYSPAPSYYGNDENERHWFREFGDEPQEEREVDAFLATQTKYDQDIWVIEVEDKEGRHFLDNQFVEID